MANIFTSARTAMIAAFEADAGIAAEVRTWRTFGAGLRKRLIIEPAWCPVLAVYPASVSEDPRYNAAKDTDQELWIRIVDFGHDPSTAEEILARVLERIDALRQTALGLTDDGCKDIRAGVARWDPTPDESGANVIWDVVLPITIKWTLFT